MANVKAIPEGYHTLNTYLVVKNVERAIDFYQRALGATEISRMKNPDGKSVMHAVLKIGDSSLMVGQEMEDSKSAETLGGSPIGLYLYVADVDQSYKKAIDAGGKEYMGGVEDMFWGDRCGTIVDPFGLQWTIATRKENLSQQVVEERGKAFFKKQAA